MCGIVGYVGEKEAYDILVEGLKKLEYRGYDSAGVATLLEGKVNMVKTEGRLKDLEEKVNGSLPGSIGIGHTRWATHGRPSDENSHPHAGCSQAFLVVHNGIIENYRELRNKLIMEGHQFQSETDTEVLSHLAEHYYQGDMLEALNKVVEDIKGSYALVFLSSHHPGILACARKDSPLVIGCGEGENFVASDIPAILNYTRQTLILEDGERAIITANTVEVYGSQGEKLSKERTEVTWDAEAAEKGGYSHFMLKEIHEQPRAIKETLRGRVDPLTYQVHLTELEDCQAELQKIEKIFIVACGTASHAGQVGKNIIEKLVRMPVEVDLASEFRYRSPLLNEKTLVLVISQSGETADTLAALRLARRSHCRVVAITNVVGSSVAREADNVMFTWAGPEIAVASTKAYITQLIVLYLFTLYLTELRNTLTEKERKSLGQSLLSLPALVDSLLKGDKEKQVVELAEKISPWSSVFFIGRGLDHALAMEGALKLKEISYIHAESYAAGELKHGTLALITKDIPVIALATQKDVFEKMESNIKEVKARDAYVLAVVNEDRQDILQEVDGVFLLPPCAEILAPVLAVVPLQLLAYYTAVKRGCDVDKPRNLAKSVTVE